MTNRMCRRRACTTSLLAPLAFLVVFLSPASPVWSHSSSTTFIEVSEKSGEPTTIRLDLPIRDVALRFDLDQDRDGNITWREVTAQRPTLIQWIDEGIQLQKTGSRCKIENINWGAASYGEEPHLSLLGQVQCATPSQETGLTIRYTLFFDQDSLHRALIKAHLNGQTMSAVASPDRPEHRLDPASSGFWAVLGTYLIEGVWHIWIGADHILFLISLLLPCVFLRESGKLGRWTPIHQISPAITNVIAVVTAFTVAHSITLGLTVLGIISPPDGLVEPIIAASVLVAAVGNITRTLIHLRWQMAFAFGLIHGFGFASVLADLGLPSEQLASALLGFNLGVELGQLAIVAVFFPIAWTLRSTSFYRWGFLFVGSILIAAVSLYWLIERIGF